MRECFRRRLSAAASGVAEQNIRFAGEREPRLRSLRSDPRPGGRHRRRRRRGRTGSGRRLRGRRTRGERVGAGRAWAIRWGHGDCPLPATHAVLRASMTSTRAAPSPRAAPGAHLPAPVRTRHPVGSRRSVPRSERMGRPHVDFVHWERPDSKPGDRPLYNKLHRLALFD